MATGRVGRGEAQATEGFPHAAARLRAAAQHATGEVVDGLGKIAVAIHATNHLTAGIIYRVAIAIIGIGPALCCQQGLSDLGLPSARDAYVEACRAASPRAAQAWSHPAVYLAGRDSDWYFLANNTERTSWPVFCEHYQHYCTRVLRGETLTMPAREALEQHEGTPLSRDDQLAELKKLRDRAGL